MYEVYAFTWNDLDPDPSFDEVKRFSTREGAETYAEFLRSCPNTDVLCVCESLDYSPQYLIPF